MRDRTNLARLARVQVNGGRLLLVPYHSVEGSLPESVCKPEEVEAIDNVTGAPHEEPVPRMLAEAAILIVANGLQAVILEPSIAERRPSYRLERFI